MSVQEHDASLSDADREAFLTALNTAAHALGLELGDAVSHTMLAHFELLLAANERVNLTRITSPAEAAVRHYADALALPAWLRQSPRSVRRVLDVGTGGGFPAVPLAIARTDWRVTAIDGTAKKIDVIRQAAAALQLSTLDAHHARAEEFEPSAGRFDLVCVRAVSTLSASVELSDRLVAKNGALVCWKGWPVPNDELSAAGDAARRYRFAPPVIWEYALEGVQPVRRHGLVVFTRIAPSH